MLAGTHLNHAACRTRTSTQAEPPEADRTVLDCQMWDEQEQEYEQEYEQEQEREQGSGVTSPERMAFACSPPDEPT